MSAAQESVVTEVVELTAFGGPEVLHTARRRLSAPGPGEVLLEVAAAGINPVDLATRSGRGYLTVPPLVLGWDVAGVVVAVGPGVGSPTVGQRVFGTIRFPAEAGGYASRVVAPASQLARVPETVPLTDAAALAMPALTGWQAVQALGVRPGERLLVTGAAGAVGRAAVQIAAHLGARVTAVTSSILAALDGVVRVAREDLPTLQGGFDAVFDPVQALGEGWLASRLAPGARVVAFGQRFPGLARRGVTAGSLLVDPQRPGLDEVARLLGNGVLTVPPYKTFPLAEAAAAHDALEGRRVHKAVLV